MLVVFIYLLILICHGVFFKYSDNTWLEAFKSYMFLYVIYFIVSHFLAEFINSKLKKD